MTVTAKICGLSTPDTAHAAVAAGASHVGFVFFPKSPRNVAPDQAAALAQAVPASVKKVGLFVNPDPALVAEVVRRVGLDIIQLHGSESPAFSAALAAANGCALWKAIPVRTRRDLAEGSAYRDAVDLLLYDAKPPEGAELPGGNGVRFDWRLLEGHDPGLPWALSGGLDVLNVREAIAITRARLVDVSSGVESAPGIKSVDKITTFLQAVASL